MAGPVADDRADRSGRSTRPNSRSEDPIAAELVELRYFAGLGHDEAADPRHLTRLPAEQQWTYAQAWLFHALDGD